MTRKNLSKDSKYRKESKEEKKARLKANEESRQACLRIAPYIIGGIILLLILFAGYVNSRPVRGVEPVSEVVTDQLSEEPPLVVATDDGSTADTETKEAEMAQQIQEDESSDADQDPSGGEKAEEL